MSGIYTYIRRCLTICAVLLDLCGCHERLQTHEGTATLKLVLNAPAYGLEFKSVSSDPDDPSGWTQWERAVDGRYLYRVTAFVLQGNRLVAHKDLELEGESHTAVLDFATNFTHGSYTLMVVANYSEHEAYDGTGTLRTYAGMQDFTQTVESLLNGGSVENFTDIYSSSFMNYRIRSTGGVCTLEPQPLTLVKTIELHPGLNEIEGELSRTYSRVRIAVDNNSDNQLKISSMSFCDIFTQSSAYLFPGNGYLNEKSAITVSSANALTPFTGSSSSPKTIPSKELDVVFDAYILESQINSAGQTYNYTLKLGYGTTSSFKTVNIPLKTIDVSTGQSVDVNEIRRNDFINVVVKVSYSTNMGHFEYEVKDWASAGGDVSFN